MKKLVSLTLVLLLLVTALVGCGSGATKTDAPAQEPAKAEETKAEAPKEEAKAEEAPTEVVSYKDGVYEGEGEGMHTIKVSVEVAGGKIAKVEIIEHEETEGIAEPALEQIPAAIVEKNTPDVEVVSGATIASDGIIEAVKNALEAAK
ncbi:FMN-binding protein [Anaerosolibacter sp.]|uniref:FMN-binding protein n=1 Tax=Anaerosolibacter sp. TaxID=1872527 RepID=UPI0039EE7BFA